jgi:D-beta-D-heptose 7-phosphate kinase/D-beta-D-heptose 1-phosphate adenosyltransferase
MASRLIELVGKLPGARIALIGDLMLDRYVYGNVERLSPDAPVPIFHHQREDARLGGAGRVAADLATLGAEVRLVSLLGDDDTGRHVRGLLRDSSIESAGVLATSRPSTCKVRLVGLAQHRHAQQMIRMDYEDASPIDDTLAGKVMEALNAALDGAQALCIEDYNKGLLTDTICRQIIQTARKRGVPTFLDPYKLSDYSKYAEVTVLTPNRVETEQATGLPCRNEQQYRAAAEHLLNTLKTEAVVLTLDRDGAYLATGDGERRWLRTRPRNVYDVAGAGDMLLATLACARCASASWAEAVALANVAAGLEVERFGSVPITPDEIVHELMAEIHLHPGKERSLSQLVPELALHRSSGKKIVFTNGCFDIVHLGHVKYFQWAKAQGDLLVVGVNTDAGIRRLKGQKRPVIGEDDRIGVLEELESIDYLIRFDEDTPIELIRQIKPDVLVKGQDYSKEQVIGWDVVEAAGGRVALAPLVDGRSTSNVIQRILEAYRS